MWWVLGAADYLHARQPNSAKGGDQALADCASFSKANTPVFLFSAKDETKDQSYFLWILTQDQLRYSLFPIGDYLKSEVREIAKQAGLPTATKKDSQGLCFVGKIDFQEFLHGILSPMRGDVLDNDGKKIGEHDGAHYYTLGQRHGLNLGGQAEPLYVAERDITTNTLVVARGDADPILFKKNLLVKNLNWIFPQMAGRFPLECLARIRYRQPLQKARITELEASGANDISGHALHVSFGSPQWAIAPGQSAVFYSDEGRMLGGGIIK